MNFIKKDSISHKVYKYPKIYLNIFIITSVFKVCLNNISLIDDNIEDLPHLIEISRKTIQTININIGFSLILNILAMFIAFFGILGPVEGALVHNIGSVIVIIYSSTLLNFKKIVKS